MRRVNVAEVSLVVSLLHVALVDIGLVGESECSLVKLARETVLVIVIDTVDLVHAKRRVGERTVNDAVGALGGVDTVSSKAELVRAPNRGLLDGSKHLEIALLVPVRQGTSVSALLLEKNFVETEEEAVPGKEGSESGIRKMG